MTTSRDQTSERGQGPASDPGNSGRAQSQSKREGPSLDEIARVIAEHLYDDFDNAFASKVEWVEKRGEKGGRFRDINEPMQCDYLDAASSTQALFSTVGSDSRVRELETERDELLRWQAASAKSHAGMNAAVEAMETRQRELEEALREVRAAIMEHAPDTLWVSLIETAVDSIDAALQTPGGEGHE